jgi:hypothetical protein
LGKDAFEKSEKNHAGDLRANSNRSGLPDGLTKTPLRQNQPSLAHGMKGATRMFMVFPKGKKCEKGNNSLGKEGESFA